MYTHLLSKLQDIVTEAKTIAILSHENPDGDAIGSMLGLGAVFEKLGKSVFYYTPPYISKSFDWIPGREKIKTYFDYPAVDFLFFLDFCSYDRIAPFFKGQEGYFFPNKIVIIDHHEGDADPSVLLIKDATASSCAELLWEIISQLYPTLIDETVATYLYFGHTTDTGNFAYEKDTLRSFRNALQMLEVGANKKLIMENIFATKTVALLRYEQRVLKRLKTSGTIVWSWYTDKDIRYFQVAEEDAKRVIDTLQRLKDYDVSILIHCKKDAYRIHFRSKKTDVARIAHFFGGGGHKNASGATIDCQKEVLGKRITPHAPSQLIEIVQSLL